MHTKSPDIWQHDHSFVSGEVKAGENRTRLVIARTGSMMVGEIGAGIWSGLTALLADGLHAASYTARRWRSRRPLACIPDATPPTRFAFGPGKLNAVAGFTDAILLFGFALVMAWESTDRPVQHRQTRSPDTDDRAPRGASEGTPHKGHSVER